MLALGVLCVAASSAAGMRSEKLGRHLCKTVNGGKFVAIPGFPGEKIDRRLIPDIRWMKRKYDIFITDGYSRDPVHAEAGEHPIGLATDIVPNASRGGTWNEIGELAHFAEPQQNEPIMPWRWVGLERRRRARAGQPPASLVVSLPKPARASRARRLYPHMPEVRGRRKALRRSQRHQRRHRVRVRRQGRQWRRRLERRHRRGRWWWRWRRKRSQRRDLAEGRQARTGRPRGSLEAAKKMDRAARRREQSPGACVVVGSGQACPRHMLATA